MATLVAAKCPNCGAALKIDPDRELVTCGYCHTSAFVKTRARPVTEEIRVRRQPVIDATESSVTRLLVWLGFGVTVIAVGATAWQHSRTSQPTTPDDPLQLTASKPSDPARSSSSSPLVEAPTASSASTGLSGVPSVASSGGVRLYPLSVSGRIDAGVVQKIVGQQLARFRRCYEQGLSRTPLLEGTVSVRFVIDREGSVSLLSVTESTLADAVAVACIAAAYRSVTFPQPEGGVVRVVSPLTFSP